MVVHCRDLKVYLAHKVLPGLEVALVLLVLLVLLDRKEISAPLAVVCCQPSYPVQ
jgi:hypothetical protein